jgi:hypothetical protein
MLPDSQVRSVVGRGVDVWVDCDVRLTDVAFFSTFSLCDVNAVRRPGPNGQEASEANDKQTPLHLAASWGLEDTVAALIEMNANVNAQVGVSVECSIEH